MPIRILSHGVIYYVWLKWIRRDERWDRPLWCIRAGEIANTTHTHRPPVLLGACVSTLTRGGPKGRLRKRWCVGDFYLIVISNPFQYILLPYSIFHIPYSIFHIPDNALKNSYLECIGMDLIWWPYNYRVTTMRSLPRRYRCFLLSSCVFNPEATFE